MWKNQFQLQPIKTIENHKNLIKSCTDILYIKMVQKIEKVKNKLKINTYKKYYISFVFPKTIKATNVLFKVLSSLKKKFEISNWIQL